MTRQRRTFTYVVQAAIHSEVDPEEPIWSGLLTIEARNKQEAREIALSRLADSHYYDERVHPMRLVHSVARR